MKAWFATLSIRTKLILIILAVSFIIVALVGGARIAWDLQQARQSLANEVSTLARLLGNRSSAALAFDDARLAQENLNSLHELPHIMQACLYRIDGSQLARYQRVQTKNNSANLQCPPASQLEDRQARFEKNQLHVASAVHQGNQALGWIYLGCDLSPVKARLSEQITFSGLALLAAILFSALLAAWLQRLISGPIVSVTSVAKAIEEQGDHSLRANVVSHDEVGQLARTFNSMLDSLDNKNRQLIASKDEQAAADARHRDELENLVEQRTAELKQTNNELESFSYSVSHDLRAPLRSISGFSQMILDDYYKLLDKEGQDLLSRVISNAGRMSELIDDLLNLSRLGRKELKTETVNLNALVEEVNQSLVEDNQDENGQHNVEFICSDLGTVTADKRLLKVVIENLLANAWKYSSKKDNTHIEMGKYRSENGDVFFVKDNGAGFNMANAEKMFAPFQRLHSHEEFEGTGIGLATVQRIIHRHGGRIWAEAEVDKGSCFYFTLGKKLL